MSGQPTHTQQASASQRAQGDGAAVAGRGRYSESQIQALVDEVLAEGFCVLRRHLSAEKLGRFGQAFDAVLRERVADGTASGRGPNRYYISLPFVMPFADPEIYEDPDILAIIERLAGSDVVMPELASDTPLSGSDYQVIHRDITQLSADRPDGDPAQPFQFAINFPLVEVTLENGPFEIARRTHRMSDAECRERIQSGEIETRLEPLLMDLGDVMVRDVRALHRGTPNRTDVPRPMIVVGYNCSWHQRPQLRIFIPRDAHARLSERGRQLLRLNPVVDSLADASNEEAYSNLYFLEQ
jgi:hypothetical protein